MTIPSHIGQYRILRKIGAGGMGLVYLGEHTLLGRRAAIKTLLPAMSANSEIVERFFNEARATSAISDPGVIQIFDFGYHVDGTAYIVMELLEGEALAARILRLGKLALGDSLRMARQIASSLASAHACEIVHRDLKPENIFLVADTEAQGGERTKVLDFGICKLGTGEIHLTQTGAMVGTPVYMSPEQCRGDEQIDGRSDIYAFGCLLFHMLTGRPPFLGEASGDLIVAHLDDTPPAPSSFVPDLPPAVDALVLRCLAKAPADRFPSMSELAHAIGELHLELDAPVAAVQAVKPATPLGRGFRSLYDGNFTGAGAGTGLSSSVRRRLPWLRYASESSAASSSAHLPARGRRNAFRVALGSVVVAGLAVGVFATWSGLFGEHATAAVPNHPMLTSDTLGAPLAARGSEPSTRSTAIAPVEAPPPAVAEPVVVAPIAAAPAPAVTVERTRQVREAPREMRATKPRLRVSEGPATPPAGQRPINVAPSVAAAAASGPSAAPGPAKPAAAATPGAATVSEDLYETR
ncbi:MAG TPA: serine/threonine-protein kinase [Kofleriaceae bacterium]|nr:serine/threonine-protein kinase [Kofleriaceae bacterium]